METLVAIHAQKDTMEIANQINAHNATHHAQNAQEQLIHNAKAVRKDSC